MTLQFGYLDWVHKGSSDQIGWGLAGWRTSVEMTLLYFKWFLIFQRVLLGMIRSFSRMGQGGLFQGQERGASSCEDRTRAG